MEELKLRERQGGQAPAGKEVSSLWGKRTERGHPKVSFEDSWVSRGLKGEGLQVELPFPYCCMQLLGMVSIRCKGGSLHLSQDTQGDPSFFSSVKG